MNRSATVLFIGYLTLLAGVASAACSRSYVASSTPYWLFTWNEWYYTGSHSATTGITNAAADWNAAQSRIELRTFTFYEDIVISDDDSIEPLEGFTSWVTQAQEGCANELDACGACLDSNVLQQVRTSLNWGGADGGITAVAAKLGWTTDQTVEEIMSHEFGHSYRLGGDFRDPPPNCTEPSIMSFIDPASCTPNFFGPTSCDVDNFNSAYSGWTLEDYDTCGQCTGNSCF